MSAFAPIASLPIAAVPFAFAPAAVNFRPNVAVVDPRFMDLPHWSALVASSLLPFGFAWHTANDSDWRQWAQQVQSLPALSALGIPDARGFATLQEWGFRLNEALLLLGS